MFWRWVTISLLLGASARSVAASTELGLSVQQLIPTHMPEFNSSIPAFGPNILIPLGGDHLRVQGLFAGQNGVTLYMAEAGYYWTVTTPFFMGMVGLGAHYMHYNTIDASYDFVGGNLGVGLSLVMSKSFHVLLEMKGYIQERSMLTAGGGFSFVL
jgi:hypothetical protein